MNDKFKQRFTLGIGYAILIVASICALFPFYWMIIGATNTHIDILAGALLPGNNLLNNLEALIATTNMGRAFFNTAIIAIIGTTLTIIVTSLAAYGFEFYRSKKREKIYKVMLLAMMIPFATLMIPLFILISTLGGIDTYWAVILPAVVSIFLIFFFRQNFKSLSKEMVEAARIDGLSELKIFFKIVVPTMKSTFSAGAILAFIGYWNSYIWPLIVMQSNDKQTLTLLISNLGSAYVIDYGVTLLAIVISTIPVIILFLVLQKQFVAGMTGSSK